MIPEQREGVLKPKAHSQASEQHPPEAGAAAGGQTGFLHQGRTCWETCHPSQGFAAPTGPQRAASPPAPH